ILAGAVPRSDGIQGRPNMVGDRVGRFGWKADAPSLLQFVGEAFRNELGMTTPMAPLDLVTSAVCGTRVTGAPALDASIVASVVAYIADLPAPIADSQDATPFLRLGCDVCHTPRLGSVPLYSDLLVHDMGRALDDAVVQGLANGHDWRTTPLWGLHQRARFL